MAEYIALRDTVYNFKFIKKGKKIVSNKLDGSPNFRRVDTPLQGNNGGNTVNNGNTDDTKIRLHAKELKIQNWHLKSIPNLLAEIAEVEAKNALPANPVNNESPSNGDGQSNDTNNPDGNSGQ